MTALSRAPIAIFSAIAVTFAAGFTPCANAAITTSHASAVDTTIAQTGFLDLKTFMVVPVDDDGDLGLASEHMRVISPETIFAQRPRTDLLKSMMSDGPGARPEDPPSFFARQAPDHVTVKVNGHPVTLSLGLEEAIRKDFESGIRHYGVPGLFAGGSGYITASYLGAETSDLIRRLDRLEEIAGKPAAEPPHATAADRPFVDGPTYVIPAPSTLAIFGTGLLVVGLLFRWCGIEGRPL